MSFDSDKWFFVFGTLKPGFTQFSWNLQIHNDHFKLACHKAYLRDYELYQCKYPTIIQEAGKYVEGYIITSEKWDELVKICDEIEEYPAYYTRFQVQVELDEDPQKKVTAWVYQMQPDRYKLEELERIGPSFQPK
ncbi:AIG2 family protein (macronuclear) [Tetrahymena thermophila SB210]|uniref:AIG2 family protein n=1 Tax=Tetrahymena thermophila (strain SB210) TaxID=312017 RepID=Q236U4_TETTS|nr:AIG2 family protein [Tetrahymena thermophila SB210]EAR92406.1 AIG2 family protein [Tetrahymena thermophila SB210]|eukprot:XP_001012651.1 AIG2 family protein [Tetrahymena thermophila SB210]